MDNARAGTIACSQPAFAASPARRWTDGEAGPSRHPETSIEVRRDPDGTRIVITRGDERRVVPLHAFVEERARAADRMRGDAMASALAAAVRACARGLRRRSRSARGGEDPHQAPRQLERAVIDSFAAIDTNPRRSS